MKLFITLTTILITMVSCTSNQEHQNDSGEASTKESKTVLGLTLEERQVIFTELQLAKQRADIEANSQYPTNLSHPNFNAVNEELYLEEVFELIDQYELELMYKYQIDLFTLNHISKEGLTNFWKPIITFPNGDYSTEIWDYDSIITAVNKDIQDLQNNINEKLGSERITIKQYPIGDSEIIEE